MSKDHDGIDLWFLLICPSCGNRKYVPDLENNNYCSHCEDLMKYWKE